MHEVQKHMTISNHGYIGYAVIVNKNFWDKLPADIRKQLDGAMVEATKYANDIAQEENDKAVAAIKAAGTTTVYTLTPAERDEWRKAMAPVYKQMESRVGKATLDAMQKAASGK
jgi:C4-dicarboxylate-binding protein DctP